MAESKNYVKGWANQKDFDNGGFVINLDLLVEDLKRLKVKDGYIKLTLSPKKEKGKYGNIQYSIYENDFVPKKSNEDTPRG